MSGYATSLDRMKAKHAAAGTAVGVPTRAAARVGPATGMTTQVLFIAALAATVSLSGGLSAAGWLVGVSCAVIVNAGMARGLSRHRTEALSPADWITLARSTFAVGVAALVAASFQRTVPPAMIVSLAAVALTLDAVDGWVARRTRTNVFGAQFDAEVDAFLILVLSVYAARFAGAWVLAIGAARYAFLAAGWIVPWMRRELPARPWRKVVAATQGVVLTIVAAQVLPLALEQVALFGALLLLAESFGRDVWWLSTHRFAVGTDDAEKTDAQPEDDDAPAADGVAAGAQDPDPDPDPKRHRVRTGIVVTFTVLAFVFVWVALVAPTYPPHIEFGAFLSIPIEGLLLIALALVLPPKGRRIMAWLVGAGLAAVIFLKVLNFGFWTGFDRPFDLYQDSSYAKIGSETLRDSIGGTSAKLVILALMAIGLALLVLMVFAVRRITTVAADHRRWSWRIVAGLGAVWLVSLAFGAHFVGGTSIASTSSAAVVVDQATELRADLRDHGVFAKQIADDPQRNIPTNQLLRGLRGKDVVLAVVESYGQVAVQGSAFSPQVDASLTRDDRALSGAGFGARSGWMTSTTFGGISWLAHSSVQAGLTVNTQRRYDQLIASKRFTLSDAFGRAGWRTVDDVPSNARTWTPGKTFYHFDQLYDRRNVGYKGPLYGYASMPDQYVWEGLQRLELTNKPRKPVFAEVDLVSSHEPWTNIPKLVGWNKLGNGSIFFKSPQFTTTKTALWSNTARVRRAYGRSIQYTMAALSSWVAQSKNPNLVVIAYGDHQPWTVVTGLPASHNIPVMIIAKDPNVLKQAAKWGWNSGLQPRPNAPVWPFSAFRNKFLSAFDPPPATR
jgi:hypothetical protein